MNCRSYSHCDPVFLPIAYCFILLILQLGVQRLFATIEYIFDSYCQITFPYFVAFFRSCMFVSLPYRNKFWNKCSFYFKKSGRTGPALPGNKRNIEMNRFKFGHVCFAQLFSNHPLIAIRNLFFRT